MTETTSPQDMLGRGGLISVAEATTRLMDSLQDIHTPEEEIPLQDGFDRVLAKPIYSQEDLPAHPRSTMDGYAVRSGDTFGASESMPCYLSITGEVFMGEMPKGVLLENPHRRTAPQRC